jgi:hypothetical protein
MAESMYTFTFEVKRVVKQEYSVRGSDRATALAFATKMLQAEQRGEPDWTLELVDESETPVNHVQPKLPPKAKRPVGEGGA